MPQFIAVALAYVVTGSVTGVGITSFVASIIEGVAYLGVTAGLYEAGQLLSPKPKSPSPQIQQQATKQAVAPRKRYYARCGRMSLTK